MENAPLKIVKSFTTAIDLSTCIRVVATLMFFTVFFFFFGEPIVFSKKWRNDLH